MEQIHTMTITVHLVTIIIKVTDKVMELTIIMVTEVMLDGVTHKEAMVINMEILQVIH